MLSWVYRHTSEIQEIREVVVATDDERIAEHCRVNQMQFEMTSTSCRTGTDRVAEVAGKRDAELYINVQGDEPMLLPETIRQVLKPFDQHQGFQVVNLMTEIKDASDVVNVTVPKVVVNRQNRAVFLSRAAMPVPKGKRPVYYKQVCVYAFTKDALLNFVKWERGAVEEVEDIEILRFIENDVKVGMVEVPDATVAVDTPGDLEVVRELMQEQLAA